MPTWDVYVIGKVGFPFLCFFITILNGTKNRVGAVNHGSDKPRNPYLGSDKIIESSKPGKRHNHFKINSTSSIACRIDYYVLGDNID